MTRTEIKQMFRDENPEITTTVISDTTLNTWCSQANIDMACRSRLIPQNTAWAMVASTAQYDLTSRITSFYDVDEYPGGGVVAYSSSTVYKVLKKTSPAELNIIKPGWRQLSAGQPTHYYRRGQYLNLVPKPDSTYNLEVYSVLLPDAWSSDSVEPFNALTHLKPFHYGIVHYLTWRAKAKVGKLEEAKTARMLYDEYVLWTKNEIGGGKYSKIYFQPPAGTHA